jgi:hypothetical protein
MLFTGAMAVIRRAMQGTRRKWLLRLLELAAPSTCVHPMQPALRAFRKTLNFGVFQQYRPKAEGPVSPWKRGSGPSPRNVRAFPR